MPFGKGIFILICFTVRKFSYLCRFEIILLRITQLLEPLPQLQPQLEPPQQQELQQERSQQQC